MLIITYLTDCSDYLFICVPSILTVFLSREWKHLTNENIVVRQRSRHSWFRPRGNIKKFRARLSIWLLLSKYVTINSAVLSLIQYVLESLFTASSLTVGRSNELQEQKIILPARKQNRFTNHTSSYTSKNHRGELFAYTASGKVRTPSLCDIHFSILWMLLVAGFCLPYYSSVTV